MKKSILDILTPLRRRFIATNELQMKTRLMVEESMALTRISGLIKGIDFVPHSNYSLSSVNLLHIINDILINKKSEIIELGPGYSSIIISKLIKYKKIRLNITCIESNYSWLSLVKEEIFNDGTSDSFTFIHAPLENYENDYNMKIKWYDKRIVESVFTKKYDIFIIDGPEGGFDEIKYSRYPSLFYIESCLNEFGSIYIDDAKREGEKFLISEIENKLGISFKTKNKYAYYNHPECFKSVPL